MIVRRSFVALALVITSLCGALAWSSPAAAELPPDLQRFAGTYAYAGSKDQGQEIIDKAFDAAMSKLNMVMRLVAKKAMSQAFAESIVITLPGDRISVKVGERDAVPTEPGKTETVSREGRTGKLTQRLNGKSLEILLEGDDGSVRNVLDLSTDGKTLRRVVTVKSPRLDKPVTYTLSYVRK